MVNIEFHLYSNLEQSKFYSVTTIFPAAWFDAM
jgi:hypothetical protein